MYTGLNTCVDVSAHDTHLPHEDKEKDIKDNKDKDKDRMLKRPNICYIFGRLGFNDFRYHILASQLVNFLLVNQARPDHLADLILQLAFLFHLHPFSHFVELPANQVI